MKNGGKPDEENEMAAAETSAGHGDGAREKKAPTRAVTAKAGREEDGMAAVVPWMSEDTEAKNEEIRRHGETSDASCTVRAR